MLPSLLLSRRNSVTHVDRDVVLAHCMPLKRGTVKNTLVLEVLGEEQTVFNLNFNLSVLLTLTSNLFLNLQLHLQF
jgi:hypothetical protein